MDDVPQVNRDDHIMLELGFSVAFAGPEVHVTAEVVPEMNVPGTDILRASIVATWADVAAGYVAMGLFDPGVPVTLDLDVHLHAPIADCGEIRLVAVAQKSGRSVSVLRVSIADGGGAPLGFGHATFMASPNPNLRMPTIVRDDGLLMSHAPRLSIPYAERAGCDRTEPGTAAIPLRPEGLNASGTLNGGLLALAVEEAALSTSPAGTTLSTMSMRYAQPVRVGPAVAIAQVHGDLAEVTVRDAGREDRLAVIATTRAFAS